jgi:hypothetical protein
MWTFKMVKKGGKDTAKCVKKPSLSEVLSCA